MGQAELSKGQRKMRLREATAAHLCTTVCSFKELRHQLYHPQKWELISAPIFQKRKLRVRKTCESPRMEPVVELEEIIRGPWSNLA